MSGKPAQHAHPAKLAPWWVRGLRVLGVALIALVSFGAWGFSSAVGSAPDDDYHLTSIWCSSYGGDICEVDPGGEGVYIPEALREAIYCYYHNPNQSPSVNLFLMAQTPGLMFLSHITTPAETFIPMVITNSKISSKQTTSRRQL